MRLMIETVPTLPKMAWAATLKADSDVLHLRAGSGVDIWSDGHSFSEGLRITQADAITEGQYHFNLTTGGSALEGHAVFWTPGHILDRLFLVQTPRETVISNSLPFALKASGTSLVATHIHYPFQFGCTLVHAQPIPIAGGRLYSLSNAMVRVKQDGRFDILHKETPPGFHDYGSYLGALHAFIDEVGAANERRGTSALRPITTISSGYDSPAVSLLSTRIGTNRALSILDSRGGTAGDDSGEQIAHVLGLTVTSALRTDYKAFGWAAERLFYVFGWPEYMPFYTFADHLKDSILFTGFRGDTMWDRVVDPIGAGWSWDPGGASLQEFRLRTGFVHLPPAVFGWRHFMTAIGISNSAAMKPWALDNGYYDRPIPRRMLEERGIPRESFGMVKRAVTETIGIDNDRYITPEDLGLTAELDGRLREHMDSHAGVGVAANMFVSNLVHDAVRRGHRSARSIRKASRKGESLSWSKRALKQILAKGQFAAVRWKYMQPFTKLSFAPHVVIEDLKRDYS
jgi:hypothetical protein